MRTHILIAALLLVPVLAACGSDPAADPAASTKKQMRDAQLAFAKCMREHGVDMPDPQPGERGFQVVESNGMPPAKARAAEEACRKYLDAIKPPELTDAQKKEFQEAALAHARCMREHGIDVPDPTFDSSGRATMKIGKGSGVRPDDPDFKAAADACAKKLPMRAGAPTTQSSP
jgi:uncharacterized protein involved in copper resistance